MQLLYSPTSPYARKVRVVILERSFSDRVTLTPVNVFGEDAAALRERNPLGKIPTLVLDEATAMFDSAVICEYLDAAAPGARLIPRDGAERWRVLREAALADGVMDAAFSLVMEDRRPPAQRSEEWQARWSAAIMAAAAQFGPSPDGGFDMGQVAMACAFGYLHFRLPALAEQAATPAVRAWWADVSLRPSVVQTTPPRG